MIAFLNLSLLTATAQFRGGGSANGGPTFNEATAKLFGDHQAFSAAMDFEMKSPASDQPMIMPGKMSFDSGKSRFEMNMSEIKGGGLPPEAAEQMKAMGMDSMVSITRPDKNAMFIIYPGMQSYVENPLPNSGTNSPDDFKMETTALGDDTVDGHSCVKNKVIITEKSGKKHESLVWNANDLKKFPVKIETTEGGHQAVMHFKNVVFTKPEASVFETPTDFKKYSSMQTMMQEVMMKKMGGMMPRH